MDLKKTTLVGIIELAIATFMFIMIWCCVGAFAAYVLPAIIISAALIGAYYYTEGESFDSKIPSICVIIVGIAFFSRTIINDPKPMEFFGYWGLMIVLPTAIFYLRRKNRKEKTDEDKPVDFELEKKQAETDRDDALDTINDEANSTYATYTNKIADAEKAESQFKKDILAHNEADEKSKNTDLKPLRTAVAALEKSIAGYQVTLTKKERDLKNHKAERVKNKPDPVLEATITEADKEKNQVEADLDTAQIDLGTAQRALAEKEAELERNILERQAAYRTTLQDYTDAISKAEKELRDAKLELEPDFKRRRRKAETDCEIKIARLRKKYKVYE